MVVMKSEDLIGLIRLQDVHLLERVLTLSSSTNPVDLSVFKLLEILRKQDTLTPSYMSLIETILLILDRLLPNQPWLHRIKLLEQHCLANRSNEAEERIPYYFCHEHKRHKLPLFVDGTPSRYPSSFLKDLAGQEETDGSADSDGDKSDTISILSSQYLRDNSTTWQLYISESKKDRRWIVQEWISATKIWRRGLLLRFFLLWYRLHSSKTKAVLFRQNALLESTIKSFSIKSKIIRKYKEMELLSRAFSSWHSFVRLQLYDNDRMVCQLGQTHHFNLWKEATAISILSHLLVNVRVWRLRRMYLRWKKNTQRRFQLISKVSEMNELASEFCIRRKLRKLIEIAQNRQRMRFFALMSTRRRLFLIWKKRHLYISQVICKDRIILEHLRLRSLRRVWQLWTKRQMLHSNLKTVFYRCGLSRYFLRWRKLALKVQILRRLSSSLEKEKSLNQQKLFFSIIKFCALGKQQTHSYSTRMKAIAFRYWLTETRSLILLSNHSNFFNYLKISKRFFKRWLFLKLYQCLSVRRGGRKQVFFFQKWRQKCNPLSSMSMVEATNERSSENVSKEEEVQIVELQENYRPATIQQTILASVPSADAVVFHDEEVEFDSNHILNIEVGNPELLQLVESTPGPVEDDINFSQCDTYQKVTECDKSGELGFKSLDASSNPRIEVCHYQSDENVVASLKPRSWSLDNSLSDPSTEISRAADIVEICFSAGTVSSRNSHNLREVGQENELEIDKKDSISPRSTEENVKKPLQNSSVFVESAEQKKASLHECGKPNKVCSELIEYGDIALENLMRSTSHFKTVAEEPIVMFDEDSRADPLACNLPLAPSEHLNSLKPDSILDTGDAQIKNDELDVEDESAVSAKYYVLSQIKGISRILASTQEKKMLLFFKRWKLKQQKRGKSEALARYFSTLQTLRSFFSKMKSQSSLAKIRNTFAGRIMKLRIVFLFWKKRMTNLALSERVVLIKRRKRSMLSSFKKWMDKIPANTKVAVKTYLRNRYFGFLNQMYNQIRLRRSDDFFHAKLMKKTYLGWRMRIRLKSQPFFILPILVNRWKSIRKRVIFQRWLYLIRMRSTADTLRSRKLLKISFLYWHSLEQGRVETNTWASLTRDRNLKVGFFRNWRFQFVVSRYASCNRFTLLYQMFDKWRLLKSSLQTVITSVVENQELKAIRRAFIYWRHRVANIFMLEDKLTKLSYQTLLVQSFSYWRDYSLTIKQRPPIVANLFLIRKAFSSWTNRLANFRHQKDTMDATSSIALLKRVFRKWRCSQKLQVHKEGDQYFLYSKRTKQIFFKKWQKTAIGKLRVYDHLRKLQHAASQYAVIRKHRLFNTWICSLTTIRQINYFKNNRTFRNTFNLWLEKALLKKSAVRWKSLQTLKSAYIYWKQRERLQKKYNRFRAVIDQHSLKRIFFLWVDKKMMVKTALKLVEEKENRYVKHLFLFWRALVFRKKRLRLFGWTQWKRNYTRKREQEHTAFVNHLSHYSRIKRVVFHYWKAQTNTTISASDNRYKERLLSKFFIYWLKRMDFVHTTNLTGERFRNLSVEYTVFLFWEWKCERARLRDIHKGKVVLLKRFWKKWKSLFQHEVFVSARKKIVALTWFEKQLQRKVLRAWARVCVDDLNISSSRAVLSYRSQFGSNNTISFIRINSSIN